MWFGTTKIPQYCPFSFDGPATSRTYFGVQFYIEDLLGRPVDLVTEKALRPEFRPYVEQEAVHM